MAEENKPEVPKMISVDASALRQVLQALIGAPYEIRELQVIAKSKAADLFDFNPIGTLVKQYNDWADEQNKEKDNG